MKPKLAFKCTSFSVSFGFSYPWVLFVCILSFFILFFILLLAIRRIVSNSLFYLSSVTNFVAQVVSASEWVLSILRLFCKFIFIVFRFAYRFFPCISLNFKYIQFNTCRYFDAKIFLSQNTLG